MRLFEVDQGSARAVLAVLQGQANQQGQSSELPLPVVMHMLKPLGLGISTPDGLRALKNSLDPAGDVIADVLDNGTVVLKTKTASTQKPDAAQIPAGPSVDQMASRNAKTAIK